MTRDDVLLGVRRLGGWRDTGLIVLAAPFELEGEPLLEMNGYSWYRPISAAWQAFADDVSQMLTDDARARAEWAQRLHKAAAEGDEFASGMLALKNPSTQWSPATWAPNDLYHGGVCAHCYETFAAYDRNVRFCSARCRRDHGRARKREWARDNPDKRPSRAKLPEYAPTCASCGATFEASRSDARYCSAACRQRARRNVKNTLALGVDVD